MRTWLFQDSWYSVLGIVDWYGDQQKTLIPAAGPGHWNDPDMVRNTFESLSVVTNTSLKYAK